MGSTFDGLTGALRGHDAYELLGVREDAPDEVIRHAYLALVKKWHSDRNRGAQAEEKTVLLNVAWEILRDHRAEYDERRRRVEQDSDGPDPWDEAEVVVDDPWSEVPPTATPPSPRNTYETPPPHFPPPQRTAGPDARLVFRRPRKYRDSMRAYILKIDGVRCGKIRPGNEVSVEVRPGVHTVQAQIDWYSSPLLEFIAQPGETVRFRVQPANVVSWLSESLNRAFYLQLEID
ncbi:MAG TPA: J domain-containing protein [Streptosporangiaceae bacterium]|jgi:hypothetical protein|nr:J domain-containing protein [Streptosporangiaceae bacterium]